MKMRSIVAALPLAAALAVGGATAASADVATAEPTTASNVSTQDVWEYTGEDFYWQSDCTERADSLLNGGHIRRYRCDGSESPLDNYSLFVVWNK